jgi:para-nitrobenzyl esterase
MRKRQGIDRRLAIAVGLAAGFTLATPAILRAQDAGDTLAECAQGKLRGIRTAGLSIFKGIAYAGSVSGAGRFKAPPAPVSWTGVRDATRLGPPSIQPPKGTSGIFEPPYAEDCLVLNIWTPACDGKRRPVMFYNHGGGYTTGSGGARGQDGGNLAANNDVVVVQTNHRLGLMGYLDLGEILGPEYQANQGMLDILAGLKWVKSNIAGFGGDPDNVMIWGESGGAGKTSFLYGMPMADAYFNKASIESGGPTRTTRGEALELAERTIKSLGLTKANARRIHDLPVEQLLAVQIGNGGGSAGGSYGAFIDGEIMPEALFATHAPTVSARKPMIVGTCRDEMAFMYYKEPAVFSMTEAQMRERLAGIVGAQMDGWISTFRRARPDLSPTDLFIAITTAKRMRADAINMAEKKAQQGTAPVYAYILTYQNQSLIPETKHIFGASHASDIRMKFDNPDIIDPPAGQERFEIFGGDRTEAHRQTAHNMSRMWANFARTAHPSAEGQPAWPAYTMARRETMLIDAQCNVVSDPERDERLFWQSLKV